MKFLKRNRTAEDQTISTDVSAGEVSITEVSVIDLSDSANLSKEEIDERHAELDRVERKLEALQMRQEVLLTELRIDQGPIKVETVEEPAPEASPVQAQTDESVLFLDETLDAFAASPPAQRTGASSPGFDIDDVEFDERFAAFTSSDEKGDHKARRWLDRA